MIPSKANGLRLVVLVGGLDRAASAQAGLFAPKGDSENEKRTNVRKQSDEMLAELYA